MWHCPALDNRQRTFAHDLGHTACMRKGRKRVRHSPSETHKKHAGTPIQPGKMAKRIGATHSGFPCHTQRQNFGLEA